MTKVGAHPWRGGIAHLRMSAIGPNRNTITASRRPGASAAHARSGQRPHGGMRPRIYDLITFRPERPRASFRMPDTGAAFCSPWYFVCSAASRDAKSGECQLRRYGWRRVARVTRKKAYKHFCRIIFRILCSKYRYSFIRVMNSVVQ